MEPESCEGDDAPAVDDSTPEERPPDGDDKSVWADGEGVEFEAKDAASGDTAENQEEEVGETSRIVIENLSCF